MGRLLIAVGLALIATGLLLGCATYDAPVKAEMGSRSTWVTWTVVEDIDNFCRRIGVGFEREIKACARWNTSFTRCDIFTDRDTTHSVLGHELQHCFDGHFHD
jgi:hypothetical protein